MTFPFFNARPHPQENSFGGKFDHLQPKMIDFFYHFEKTMEVDRFDNVAIGRQAVGLKNIFIVIGGGQHDDRDDFKLLIAADSPQDLSAVHFGHVEIQQNQIRSSHPRVIAFAA